MVHLIFQNLILQKTLENQEDNLILQKKPCAHGCMSFLMYNNNDDENSDDTINVDIYTTTTTTTTTSNHHHDDNSNRDNADSANSDTYNY